MILRDNPKNIVMVLDSLRKGKTIEEALIKEGGSGRPLECEMFLRQIEACFGRKDCTLRELVKPRHVKRECPYCHHELENGRCRACKMRPCKALKYIEAMKDKPQQ